MMLHFIYSPFYSIDFELVFLFNILILFSNSKAEMKDETNSMEHVQEHDLKGAASLFTLKNCNTSSV